MSAKTRPTKLIVRNATTQDVDSIVSLSGRVYKNEPSYTPGMIRGQLTAFPDGQFVVEYEGDVVGYAATFIVNERIALAQHSWGAITGGGYAARHDGKGDWLYGMEVMVDPARRRLRIGQRLYEARRALCEALGLKGTVFGGRLPGFQRKRKLFSDPVAYLEAVRNKEVRDPVANFHLRMGFESIGVLHNYNTEDRESGGMAAHMVWRNPHFGSEVGEQPVSRRDRDTVRVATIQFQMRSVDSVDEFFSNVEYFVDIGSDYQADFVVFPEMFTLALLTLHKEKLSPDKALEKLTEHTPEFVRRMRDMAIGYNINIIGGSHPTQTDDGDLQNVGYVFLRDGAVHEQEKLHPTPDEKYWWNIQGGDSVKAIQTDCGPIGVMICYDSEFPEQARRLADEGARILFVPFQTDNRQGYLRVRYCCQARAIENQCYVVTSGNCGNLPHVENLDINYAQSAILTPCDFPFARDGIAAEATENVEQVVVADLNLSQLDWARSQGSVRNLRDRRFDLYKTRWTDGG